MNQELPHVRPSSGHRIVFIRRHSAVTRLTHWINLLCLAVLLASGLQIFNAYPRLHWGQYGADADPALFEIGATDVGGPAQGFISLGRFSVPTTGALGLSTMDGEWIPRAFPAWLTLPSYQDLAAGRRWHFFFAWAFVANGLLYLGHGLASDHFRRDLALGRRQLTASHLWRELVDHARLRFPSGDAARHYNTLQKLTYLGVIAGLLPLMLLTGLTLSPGMDAAFPVFLDLFGGRQSARTLHFLCASLLVLFVIVHVVMVVVSGARNNMRAMVTGRYAIAQEGKDT